jgi:AcrR family transcriptional regulator
MSSNNASIGVRIRRARLAAGITLRDLAERIGVSPATMSLLENGKARAAPDRLQAIAKAVGLANGTEFTRRDRGVDSPEVVDVDWRRFEPLALGQPLTGALELFLEVGYHGASVRDIAQRARLSVPGVYHHYPSKQAMLVALVDLSMEELVHKCRLAHADGGSAVTRFSHLVECVALFHMHRAELGFVGASELRSLEPGARRRYDKRRAEVRSMFEAEIKAAIASGDFRRDGAREARVAIVTMCTALPQWFHHDGRLTAEQIAKRYVEFALRLMSAAKRT